MNFMILLQAAAPIQQGTINGVDDVTWTTGNLITLAGLVIAFAGAWIKMLVNKTKLEARIEALEKDIDKIDDKYRNETATIIAAKSTIKRELNAKIKETTNMLNTRIDDTNKRAEKQNEKTEKEFKEINTKLEAINMGIGEIKGILGNGKQG